MQVHAVLIAEDELARIIHQVRLLFLTLVHHQVIHGKHLAAVGHVQTDREPLHGVIQRGFERMFVAVFEVFGVIGLVLHLQRVGVVLLRLDAGVVVQVLRLGEGITDGIEQTHVFPDIHLALCADLHAVDTCMADIDELRTDAYACAAERLGRFDAVQHTLQLVDDIIDGVDHRVVGVTEKPELVLNHILIFGVETRYVQRTGDGTELIQLFVAQLGVEARLRLDGMVGIDSHSADVLAGEFLGDGGVAVALTEAGAEEPCFVNLPVQTGTEDRTHRTEPFSQLDVRLVVTAVHTIVFQTHTCAQRQTVGNPVVVLDIRSKVVGLVRAGDVRRVGDMVPVDTGGQTHAGLPLFGKLVIDIPVVGQFGACRLVVC